MTKKDDLKKVRDKKIIKLLYVFLFFICILFIRLFYLQVNKSDLFVRLGKKNFLRTEFICPLRGNLLDCNGELLAANKPVFDLYWEGFGVNNFSEEQKNLLNKLANILNLDLSLASSNFKNLKIAEKNLKKFLLKSDITFKELCCLCESCSNSANLLISTRFKRVYPKRKLAGHVLGYLSRKEDDYTTIGITGIEKTFQKKLKGEVGYVLNIINSKGRTLYKKDFKQAKSGNDIKLTLDWQLQTIAENLFAEDQAGAFILIDPEDGSIKALLSYPNFDPNLFLDPISHEDWDSKLSYNNPLLNRVTNAAYPPASTFKLVTLATGLEEGIIDTNSTFMCEGYIKFYGRKYRCIRRWGHGSLDAKTALAYSCNIPCFKIAKRVKINQLADYAFRFGLGRKTGFLLPEIAGLIPTYEWKLSAIGESWWKGETLSASIGQSYALVTPIQVARMVSGICMGYLIKPKILEEEKIEREDLLISKNCLKFLREAMRGVVLYGSALELGQISGFEVFAKTGTAQTSSLDIKRVSKIQLEHAWLASYFSYKGEKPLTMVVLVENAGSSAPARRIAANFLKAYKKFREGLKLEELTESFTQTTSTTSLASSTSSELLSNRENIDN